MDHEANNANSKANHSRSCSGFFVGAIHDLERDMKVYLLMRRGRGWYSSDEVISIYATKKSAQDECDKRNWNNGRHYDYSVKVKVVKG
ncbi:hypothetical protein CUU52_14405 [Pectobacterium polaris]|nr:hypothetical protein [Pectobacterium polaris]